MRKIVQHLIGVKDENGIYQTVKVPEPEKPKKFRDPKASEISLDDLMEKHLTLLYRETRNLLMESSEGKLGKDSAHSMRENMKLIVELKKKEKEVLSDMSVEELEKLTNEKNV